MWGISVDALCERIDGEGLTCMICEERLAAGHTTVGGGPFNGRLLLVHCSTCVPAADDDATVQRIKGTLVLLAVTGLLDLRSGGPGPKGDPPLVHGDHFDPWPVFPDHC